MRLQRTNKQLNRRVTNAHPWNPRYKRGLGEQKRFPVGAQLTDKTIDNWFEKDWSDKSKTVENNGSTSDLTGGQKEAMTNFVFNGLSARSYIKGSDETFFLGYLKGDRGTVKKRVGEVILFRDNKKVNLDYVDDKKSQKSIQKSNQGQ